MRSMVEGAHLRADSEDVPKHGIHVLQHVSRCNAHDVEAISLKQCVADEIAVRLVGEPVCFSVYFDDQAMTQAGEIRGNPAAGELPAEFEPTRPLP